MAPAKSDLLVGDEICRWNNGEPPRHQGRRLNQQKPGDVLRLRIRRDDKEMNLELHLGEQREKFFQVAESSNGGDRGKRIREGLFAAPPTPSLPRIVKGALALAPMFRERFF